MTLGQIRLDRREMMERTRKLAALEVELLHLAAVYPASQNQQISIGLMSALAGAREALGEARHQQTAYQEEWRRG